MTRDLAASPYVCLRSILLHLRRRTQEDGGDLTDQKQSHFDGEIPSLKDTDFNRASSTCLGTFRKVKSWTALELHDALEARLFWRHDVRCLTRPVPRSIRAEWEPACRTRALVHVKRWASRHLLSQL